jgi:hypothetical protein
VPIVGGRMDLTHLAQNSDALEIVSISGPFSKPDTHSKGP